MNLRKLMKWGLILILLLAYKDMMTDNDGDNRELAGPPALELPVMA